MTIADGATALLEATWRLSADLVPAILLAFLLLVPRMDGDLPGRIIASQRDATLRYGLHLTAGLLGGGAVTLLVPGPAGLGIATAVVAAMAALAYRTEDTVAAAEIGDDWRARIALAWLALPVLAAAALATQDPVLKRATALVLYGTIFWVV